MRDAVPDTASLDAHAGGGHATGEFSELPRLALTELLNEYVTLRNDANARRIERSARRSAIGEEEVRRAVSDTASFDAHPGTAERLAHLRESTGTVVERDGQVFHVRGSIRMGTLHELAMKHCWCAL